MNNLQNNKRLKGFGLFVNRDSRFPKHKDKNKKFVENFIKQIDLEYGINELHELNYDLSALLSIINDPNNEINHYESMPDKVLTKYEYLKDLLQNEYGFNRKIFDHIFWYENKLENILVIESHPYSHLSDNEFKLFTQASEKHPNLTIQIYPNSHYFANHTLYIKFIIENPETFGE